MRKQIINRTTQNSSPADERWLDLECLAQTEVTSENPEYPIESALIPGAGSGWRAAQPGEQTIRVLFDELQSPAYSTTVSRISAGAHARIRAEVVVGQESVLPGDCTSAI